MISIDKADASTVLVFLLAGIASLWAIIRKRATRDQAELALYKASHDLAHEEIKKLHGEYQYLKGRMDGVEQLSASVLSEIKKIKLKSS